MKCPVDGTALLITERAGVEIDYCPQCRGVWLDRGELDKIIDRAADLAGGGRQTSTAPYPREGDHRSDRDRDHHGRSGRRRKEGFLGDLFDF